MLERKVWVCPRCKAQISAFLEGTVLLLQAQHEVKCARTKFDELVLTEDDIKWLKEIRVSGDK